MSTLFSDAYPKLRPIDLRAQTHNGQPYVLLRDPLQLSENVLLLPQPLAAILHFCDGTRTAAAVAADFSRHYGVKLPDGIVENLLQAMDEACLLENSRARAAQRAALDLYRSADCRKPALAGMGYPADANELHELLELLLDGARSEAQAASTDAAATVGLLSPHIDYPRGGHVYAQVWDQAAVAAQEADLVILIGTDHQGYDPFTLTRQSYATPYGILPTPQPIVDALVEVIGHDAAFAGELRHRTEHSLELVAVWLHHMRGGKAVELVPILVGSFYPYMLNGTSPADDPTIAAVLEVLHQAGKDRRTLVVASGDLAHVGPAFGGQPLTTAARNRVRAADEELIQAMQDVDPERFFLSIRRIRDRNNVCGVVPIYLTMQLLARLHGNIRGQQAGYAACPADDNNTSDVTIAGMLFQAG